MKAARLARVARSEIAEARRTVHADSPRAAQRLQAAVLAAAELLGEHPYAGTTRAWLPRPYRIRVLQGFPYLLVYNPDRRPPLVLRFVHGSRDLPAALSELASSTDR